MLYFCRVERKNPKTKEMMMMMMTILTMMYRLPLVIFRPFQLESMFLIIQQRYKQKSYMYCPWNEYVALYLYLLFWFRIFSINLHEFPFFLVAPEIFSRLQDTRKQAQVSILTCLNLRLKKKTLNKTSIECIGHPGDRWTSAIKSITMWCEVSYVLQPLNIFNSETFWHSEYIFCSIFGKKDR